MILPWVAKGRPVDYYSVAELIQSAVSTTELVLRSDNLGYRIPAVHSLDSSPDTRVVRVRLVIQKNVRHVE
ncbi:hypothetical protein WAI453_012689 [Rhynchosporium graminicola]